MIAPVIATAGHPSPAIANRWAILRICSLCWRRTPTRCCAVGAIRHTAAAAVNSRVTNYAVFWADEVPPAEPPRPHRCTTNTVEDRPLDEEELVARAQRGELDAYEEIVRAHQTIAFRTAWVITGSAADAEEAAQDAFVKAHAALPRFRAGSPFRPWLLTIVANEARNRAKAAGRRERLALRAREERRPGGAVPSPEAALLLTERRGELLEAVGRLSESDRQAIACRYFLDLSEAETAAALGCARGTVKSRLSRALERLRAQMEVGDD
jgi:RNA polymerase sigma factor (sigma-70 family)